jgi:hypothetical protein
MRRVCVYVFSVTRFMHACTGRSTLSWAGFPEREREVLLGRGGLLAECGEGRSGRLLCVRCMV